MIKVVAFDFGGVYEKGHSRGFFKQAGEKLGISEECFKKAYLEELTKAHKGHITAMEHFKRISLILKKETGKKFAPKELYDACYSIAQSNPEMMDLIKRLKTKYTVALFSNHTTMLDDLDKKWNIYEKFHHSIVSSKVGMEKPEPKFYKYLIKKVKCKPDEIVFIDDIEKNIKAGRKLGIQCILFNGNFQKLSKQLKRLTVNIK